MTQVIDLMKNHFGDLPVIRGNKHRVLGTNITINSEKSLEIEMKDQLLNVIDMFACTKSQDVEETVTLPAQKHVRDVKPDCKPLSNEKRESFYTIVATLLWIMKRPRPDLETTVDFLCTRVSKSDEDGWKKLRRVIAFFNQP